MGYTQVCLYKCFEEKGGIFKMIVGTEISGAYGL